MSAGEEEVLFLKEAIKLVVEGKDLEEQQAEKVMDEIMGGKAQPTQIACFLTALRMKGETVPEITGCARSMRRWATKIATGDEPVVDTCGTGGDGAHTFNVSTLAALVTAGAGVRVAKHGNRSVSSRCGSADLLKELGVKVDAPPAIMERCLGEVGIAFLFAPSLHKAMKYAIGPRREMGIRTIFNILGPLTNPAGAKAQLLGVYDGRLTELLARVLQGLGSERVFVVHGEDGLDEITLTGETKVSELNKDKVTTYQVRPEDYGLKRCSGEKLRGAEPAENAEIARQILGGKPGDEREVVVLNSAFAIVAGGGAGDIKEGIEKARQSLDSGNALAKLEGLARISQEEP